MKTIFSLLSATMLLVTVTTAQMLPSLPQSDRTLERKEVKNYWIACISATPPPPWDTHGRERQWSLINAIRDGHYDEQAEITRLRHNIGAFLAQGRPGKAREVEQKLQKRLATCRIHR